MIPCICGHGHLTGATCYCGCALYEPEEIDEITEIVNWQIRTRRGL